MSRVSVSQTEKSTIKTVAFVDASVPDYLDVSAGGKQANNTENLHLGKEPING